MSNSYGFFTIIVLIQKGRIKLKTSFLDTVKITKTLKKLISDSDEIHWAVAWGTTNKLTDKLIDNKKKIKKIIIGIDFSHTDPKLLQQLSSSNNSKVAIDMTQGTFHPKIYYFESKNKATAIVGSANFTNGGVEGNNIEAAILIEGSVEDEPLIDIKNMVNSLWEEGSPISKDFLVSYELQYEANKKHKNALNKKLRINKPKFNAAYPNLLTMSWNKYRKIVKSSKPDYFKIRLDVLNKYKSLFNSVESFSELDILQRKAIAGIISINEIKNTELENYNWGLFGSMHGDSGFKNRISENDDNLSLALDHIPTTGYVSEDDYNNFIEHFQTAFENLEINGGVPTASRLLAMKRPDQFICISKLNRRKLSRDLGFTESKLDFNMYWSEIIEPIMQSVWWQSPRPSGISGKLWDGRVAMLDTIYYEPK